MFDDPTPQPPIRDDRRVTEVGQSQEPEQKRLMVAALVLLVACLGIVLYRDRDFWFPDAGQDVAHQTLQGPPNASANRVAIPGKQDLSEAKKVVTRRKAAGQPEAALAKSEQIADSVPPLTVTRTVLPPLEVEVVAGNAHRTLRPESNSLRVDLQPDEDGESKPSAPQKQIPTSITTNAAERTPISEDTSAVVTQTVQPGYPLLARQMKVQGSVILQALIGRDGLIQNIHVVSGPPILATAAQEAVKQWHFKPHYEGSEAVETQAKITVNFIISTN